jgi:hypothetical protein
MTDAINAKSDVLGDRELDAVSGGMSIAPFVAVVDQFIKAAGGGTSGGCDDPKDGLRFCGTDRWP